MTQLGWRKLSADFLEAIEMVGGSCLAEAGGTLRLGPHKYQKMLAEAAAEGRGSWRNVCPHTPMCFRPPSEGGCGHKSQQASRGQVVAVADCRHLRRRASRGFAAHPPASWPDPAASFPRNHPVTVEGLTLPASQKPGVNWIEAATAYASGCSLAWIAKRFGVSRQAVSKRAQKEGWTYELGAAALAATATGQRIITPKEPSDFRLVSSGKKSMAAMQRALDMLACGGTRRLVAARLGMTEEHLREWLREDGDFARMAGAAEAEAAMRRIGRLEAAGERGDAATDRWLLERSPSTRQDFAPQRDAGSAGGEGVTINLVLSAASVAVLSAAPIRPVIEGTSTSGDGEGRE